MSYETIPITDEQFWQAGMKRRCVYHAIDCRFEPCTVTWPVRCCAECMKCGNPCPIARKAMKR